MAAPAPVGVVCAVCRVTSRRQGNVASVAAALGSAGAVAVCGRSKERVAIRVSRASGNRRLLGVSRGGEMENKTRWRVAWRRVT